MGFVFKKKGNFPLLNIIKAIFLSPLGYSLYEVRSVSSPPGSMRMNYQKSFKVVDWFGQNAIFLESL